MDPSACKEKPRVKEPVSRVEKTKQKSQPSRSGSRQRAGVCALKSCDRTGASGEQLGGFCEQTQPPGE
uniref:Uncharacterized protein n=1 Tax=Capra hircus TaxID=9925 RepID=A0A8C2NV25_CAPHI